MTRQSITTISPAIRRRYILGQQGLWPGRRWTGQEGTEQAVNDVEAVQVDPVVVLAQSHDLMLWGRVLDYQPQQLLSVLYKERKFFDYGALLMIYPMSELPYWRIVMERQKSHPRWATFAEENASLIDEVREIVRTDGPLRKRDLAGREVTHYRARKDSGVALHYLWLTGELMTHHRHGKERVYAFREDVAPAHLQYAASVEEAEAFFARKTIAHHGLVTVRTFRKIWKSFISRPVDQKEAKTKLAEMVEAGEIVPVKLENDKSLFYLPQSHLSTLDLLQQGKPPPTWQPLETNTGEEVTFLSPLDYVSARKRAAKLFDFDYIWEIYKPAHKRKYGPYTLPVLYGDQLVARMDAKFHRETKELAINGFWLEAWFEVDDAFVMALKRGLARLMSFLGAEGLTEDSAIGFGDWRRLTTNQEDNANL